MMASSLVARLTMLGRLVTLSRTAPRAGSGSREASVAASISVTEPLGCEGCCSTAPAAAYAPSMACSMAPPLAEYPIGSVCDERL
jgi:hypothetical protein